MRRAVFATLIVASFISQGSAQQASVSERYVMQDVMIPTRDGTRLHTRVLTPIAQSGPLPFIMERTPYGIGSPRWLPGDAVRRLTRLFEKVRYGGYRTDSNAVNEAVACLTTILHYCGEAV